MGCRAVIVRLRVAARRASWLSFTAACGAAWWLVAERRVWWPAAGVLSAAAVAAAIAVCAAVVALLHAVAPAALERRVAGASADAVPRAVMVSALVGMVVCLFLAPHLAWGYVALAAAWLVAAALPRAALGAGVPGDAPRQLLVATAAGSRARPARTAARLVAGYAAVLVWPPLVAAVLAGSSAAAREPLMIGLMVAAAAATIAGTVAGVLAAGGSRDMALAVTLGATVACATLVPLVVPGARQPPAAASEAW